MQNFAVFEKQNSSIFQTTLATLYRQIAGNMKHKTAASVTDFPSEKKLFLNSPLFSAHRSSGEATGQRKGFSGRGAPGRGFHLSCSLHT